MSSLIKTPIDILNQILDNLVQGINMILQDNLLGIYLSGSFAHGGWDADSDIDFCVVVEEDLKPNQLADLKVLHARIYTIESYWSRHLEGSYFPKAILGDLDRTDEPVWYLDNGSLNFERSTHDNTLVVRWVLRECGVCLYGPEPAVFIPSVPDDKLKAEVWQTMQDWGEEILTGTYIIDNCWVQPFAVLIYCRMMHTLATGRVDHKMAGASWALDNLDAQWERLIRNAMDARPNQYDKYYQASNPDDNLRTIQFVRYALDLGKSQMG